MSFKAYLEKTQSLERASLPPPVHEQVLQVGLSLVRLVPRELPSPHNRSKLTQETSVPGQGALVPASTDLLSLVSF